MSRFYVSASGSGKTMTQCGHVNSGAVAHARGWDVGGLVEAMPCHHFYTTDDDRLKQCEGDRVTMYRTHGSNESGVKVRIANFCPACEDRKGVRAHPKGNAAVAKAISAALRKFDDEPDDAAV